MAPRSNGTRTGRSIPIPTMTCSRPASILTTAAWRTGRCWSCRAATEGRYDHHANGYFTGAMDPELETAGYDRAMPLVGEAGSMTIHHARLVHGSALNTSSKPRRLLLYEYAAADAWPLMGLANFEEFNGRIVRGKPTIEPRLVPTPVRMPLPPSPFQGSIYENQKANPKRFFAKAAE